jgi:glycosyltransferase involved in cell wall biosynthesis
MSTPLPAGPVAYLVNRYPKVSHTFIRREIRALERLGVTVDRIAVRGWSDAVADAEDERERAATRYLLQGGMASLIGPTLRAMLRTPRAFGRALALAWRLGRRADRARPYHLVYLMQACRLVEWLHRSRAVHLHAHFGTNPAEVALLTRVLGGPAYSFTVHGPEEFDKATVLQLADKVRDATFVVAISAYGASQLYRWIDARDWGKVRVVPCGLDAGFDVGADDRPVPDVARFVCIGRLSEQKGQLLLVEAVRRLVAKGRAVELVLAGDGEMRPAIEAAIGRAQLDSQVRITGWISGDAVRRELLASRALVLASFAEGLPIVLMEAMAVARPVVTTWVAGVPELVLAGETGWLVPPGDVDALVAALEGCLDAPVDTLREMGRRGHARVWARHDVDRSAATLAEAFAARAST